MTAEELQDLVRLLANRAGWVRYWLRWGCPQLPARMAISIKDGAGQDVDDPLLSSDLVRRGFRRVVFQGSHYWIVGRTNTDGTPFLS